MSQSLTPSRPSTPMNQSNAPSAPSTPATGSWKHPRLDEIIKRQNASTFSDRSIRVIAYNVGGAITVWFIGETLWTNLPSFFSPNSILQPYAKYAYFLLQLLFIYNIFWACAPLLRNQDTMEDIPLTPAQRKLFGLPPRSKAPTPDAKYSTPPRYRRTPTLNNSPGSKGSFPNSPLSGKGRESPLGESFGSQFSPGSPLLQKAMGSGIGTGIGGSRRHSYGSASPLGPGNSRFGWSDAPGSPSPSTAKNPSVGLNSKWLYDKERRNSGSARLYT